MFFGAHVEAEVRLFVLGPTSYRVSWTWPLPPPPTSHVPAPSLRLAAPATRNTLRLRCVPALVRLFLALRNVARTHINFRLTCVLIIYTEKR